MTEIKRIQVFGKEGPDSYALLKNAKKAAKLLKIHKCTFHLITDEQQFLRHGIFLLPGLVTDGNVRVIGRVASVEELVTFFGMILAYQQPAPSGKAKV